MSGDDLSKVSGTLARRYMYEGRVQAKKPVLWYVPGLCQEDGMKDKTREVALKTAGKKAEADQSL